MPEEAVTEPAERRVGKKAVDAPPALAQVGVERVDVDAGARPALLVAYRLDAIQVRKTLPMTVGVPS
jgi:hypothetical protein